MSFEGGEPEELLLCHIAGWMSNLAHRLRKADDELFTIADLSAQWKIVRKPKWQTIQSLEDSKRTVQYSQGQRFWYQIKQGFTSFITGQMFPTISYFQLASSSKKIDIQQFIH